MKQGPVVFIEVDALCHKFDTAVTNHGQSPGEINVTVYRRHARFRELFFVWELVRSSSTHNWVVEVTLALGPNTDVVVLGVDYEQGEWGVGYAPAHKNSPGIRVAHELMRRAVSRSGTDFDSTYTLLTEKAAKQLITDMVDFMKEDSVSLGIVSTDTLPSL